MDYEQHEQAIMEAFAEILKAEQAIMEAKVEKREAEHRYNITVSPAELQVADAWVKIQTLMNETGEVEVILPDENCDYKICYTTPRESVKVDADAVPDEFVKIERKPKLKEIGEYLKGMPNDSRLNWASLEKGEAKLTYKLVKKGK